GRGGKVFVLSTGAGGVVEAPALAPATPIRWGQDGRSLYVRTRQDAAGRIFRVDPATGERELWKELLPPDPAGVTLVDGIHLSADARSYSYTYSRRLLDLYVVDGLQ